MSSQLDLQLLKAEESALMRISSKLSDQLNRLKVEELALLSQIRKSVDAQEGLFSDKDGGDDDVGNESTQHPNFTEPLDLRPSTSNIIGSMGEEEEEEDVDSATHDQLTAFMKQLDKS